MCACALGGEGGLGRTSAAPSGMEAGMGTPLPPGQGVIWQLNRSCDGRIGTGTSPPRDPIVKDCKCQEIYRVRVFMPAQSAVRPTPLGRPGGRTRPRGPGPGLHHARLRAPWTVLPWSPQRTMWEWVWRVLGLALPLTPGLFLWEEGWRGVCLPDGSAGPQPTAAHAAPGNCGAERRCSLLT